MSEAVHRARMENMKKAKNAWKLRMDGKEVDDIAKQLSSTTHTINKIFKYTSFSYYLDFKEKQSHYDAKLTVILQIENERKKLKKITNTIAQKKQVFLRIFEVTIVLIVLLIAI